VHVRIDRPDPSGGRQRLCHPQRRVAVGRAELQDAVGLHAVDQDREEPPGRPVDDRNPFAQAVLFQFQEQRRRLAMEPCKVSQVTHDGRCLPPAVGGNLPDARHPAAGVRGHLARRRSFCVHLKNDTEEASVGNARRTTNVTRRRSSISLACRGSRTTRSRFISGCTRDTFKNTNLLNEQISGLIASGSAAGSNPGYAELKRRLGFEYNGMVLHEYYFGNMTKTAGSSAPAKVQDCVAGTFGDFETWKKRLLGRGRNARRRLGDRVLRSDHAAVNNHWITLHEDGNVAGYVPLLVMDVWEHAFLLDYKPAERSKYIESFFLNVDWGVVNRRLEAAKAGRTP